MGTAMVSANKSIADEYVRRYQQSTKNAIEGDSYRFRLFVQFDILEY